MTLDNMTGITKGSYTGFCKSQLITCNFVKACNGVCPFEDALKHADQMQTMNEQHIINHDRDWIPVSERLPDEYGDYLVTKETTGWNMSAYITIDIAYFDTVWHKAGKVLAWMPLPEPYKGGDSE